MFLCHFAVCAGILRVHPDLAGRIADIGRLTSESLWLWTFAQANNANNLLKLISNRLRNIASIFCYVRYADLLENAQK